MLREFRIDFRGVEEFDTLVALSMATEGIGAAVYIFSCIIELTTGILTGLILVALGALGLFLHLGRPLKFWRVIVRSKSAWISRGALFTVVFLFFAVLALSAQRFDFLSTLFQMLGYIGGMAILLYTCAISVQLRRLEMYGQP